MLVVAAAVGVASCFGAPISGERASKGLALGIHYFYLCACAIFVLLCFYVHPYLSASSSFHHLPAKYFDPLTSLFILFFATLLRVQHLRFKFHTLTLYIHAFISFTYRHKLFFSPFFVVFFVVVLSRFFLTLSSMFFCSPCPPHPSP